jgi:hypothetical protein
VVKVLVFAAVACSGFVMGVSLMAARHTNPPPPASDCAASETGAERCDRALLTALSVQVRMLHQLEALELVCGPSTKSLSHD